MNKNQSLCEEQGNLRIVESLDVPNLPESIQEMLSMASTPEEKDIVLMATLTAASACMPNLYFRYGPTGKKYYANLQTFILAASASGKGIANQALKMVEVVDRVHPLLVAGDSTLAAWYKAMADQGGCGYMHESEGSVITDIWRANAANYNTALRKAAEHETISRNRFSGTSAIACPRLSMLLTGTFNQYRMLVPSVENGYFSRLLTVVIRDIHPFDKRYVSVRGTQSLIPMQVGNRLLRLYERLMAAGEQEWSLSEAQKERLGDRLEREYGVLIGMLGENFHSAVIRMGIQIERIAMILTAMRVDSTLTRRAANEPSNPYICGEADFEAAETIGIRLLLHMAQAYRLIDGEAQEAVPEMKPIDQRKVVFEQLKVEYTHKDLAEEARRQGISNRTVERWNLSWLENGLIQKTNHGEYRKVG